MSIEIQTSNLGSSRWNYLVIVPCPECIMVVKIIVNSTIMTCPDPQNNSCCMPPQLLLLRRHKV
eukprot:1136447-Pelagomonas_calceolata.AAC.3